MSQILLKMQRDIVHCFELKELRLQYLAEAYQGQV